MIKETDGPAFPTQHYTTNGEVQWGSDGMTLRDYFAAKALQARMTAFCSLEANHGWTNMEIAIDAYAMADAMLKARETK